MRLKGGGFSGPMFEQDSQFWQGIPGKTGAHYNIYRCPEGKGIAMLKDVFPDGIADNLNFCLFSTSGVHGTYSTIEDAERLLAEPSENESGEVTFLVIQPRLVCMRYGNCTPESADDIAYLKKLRETSMEAIKTIGY